MKRSGAAAAGASADREWGRWRATLALSGGRSLRALLSPVLEYAGGLHGRERLALVASWYGGPKRGTALGALALVLLMIAVCTAGHLARLSEMAVLRREVSTEAALRLAVLRSELEKHRSMPLVLAEDPDVIALLQHPNLVVARALDDKFERIAAETRAAAVYVMDRKGITLAASNWRRPTSFVGSNYGFRPYFKALYTGSFEYFALGNVSRRPGLFLARRVDGPNGPLGVVVVKVEFDQLESEWRTSDTVAFVTNNEGVVLITSRPDWRFRTIAPLTPQKRAAIWRKQQFGDAMLTPLPLQRPGRDGEIWELPQGEEAPPSYIQISVPAPAPRWQLHLLKPSGPVLRSAVLSMQFTTLVLGAAAMLGLAVLLLRHERQKRRAAERAQAQAELERRVEQRTAELREANQRLIVEMEERRRAETAQQLLQDELVQANKLAVLGQIAVGVAHEINQPVAAIRTYADSASILLDRNQEGVVKENLAVIASLTERIGSITDDLRAFSRKTKRKTSAVALEAAVAAALRLMAPRLRQHDVKLVSNPIPADLRVQAERVRLEQVLVNLLHNAVEAVAGRPAPCVRLSLRTSAETVSLTVSDNGPGLDPSVAEVLFTPFATTKPNGLGLGLVISKDIMTEFGGELVATEGDDGGAAFELVLRRRQW